MAELTEPAEAGAEEIREAVRPRYAAAAESITSEGERGSGRPARHMDST